MNTSELLTPVTRTLVDVPPVPVLTQLGWSALLGWMGLAQRQHRRATQTSLVAVGVVLGAGAALLLAPSSGRELRARLGKGAGGSLGGWIGKQLGAQVGAHPVRTAKLVEAVRERVSPEPT